MLFTSFLFTSFLALVKYGNIDQIRQKLYYHWCDREEKLLLFPEFVSRSARFLKVMRETAVHSFPDSRFPFPVPGSPFLVLVTSPREPLDQWEFSVLSENVKKPFWGTFRAGGTFTITCVPPSRSSLFFSRHIDFSRARHAGYDSRVSCSSVVEHPN